MVNFSRKFTHFQEKFVFWAVISKRSPGKFGSFSECERFRPRKVQTTKGPFPSFIFCHLSSRKCNSSRCDLLNPLVSLPLTNQTKFPLKCCNGIILHLNLPSLINQIRLLWVDMSITLLTMSIIIHLTGVRLSRSCNTTSNIKEIYQWKLAVFWQREPSSIEKPSLNWKQLNF